MAIGLIFVTILFILCRKLILTMVTRRVHFSAHAERVADDIFVRCFIVI